ncbi:MAG: hypothetical protein ACD_7C00265G0001, partial [uncultured bacterium]
LQIILYLSHNTFLEKGGGQVGISPFRYSTKTPM